MRVISGQARGRALKPPAGNDIRPTSDKTKEAMFSILLNDLPGARVLDLFAGSGQLGIEALSRGARLCVFVDTDRRAQELVRENLRRTGFAGQAQLVPMDGPAYLSMTPERFDIALLDPPYKMGVLEKTLPLAAAKMAPNGVILCETDLREELPARAGDFEAARTYRYGKTKVTLYRRAAPGVPEEELQ